MVFVQHSLGKPIPGHESDLSLVHTTDRKGRLCYIGWQIAAILWADYTKAPHTLRMGIENKTTTLVGSGLKPIPRWWNRHTEQRPGGILE